MRHVSDDERRARLAVRHTLAPAFYLDSPEAATRAMTVLHATEPATVYLSCWARVGSVEVTDVDRALYDDRSLVKQLAMRRTLFVFPRELLAAAWPSASARVAGIERKRLSKDAVRAGLSEDGDDWLDRARAEVLEVLADAPEGRPAREVRQAVPMIDVKVEARSFAAGSASVAPASRVLTHLGATADIVRGTNAGHWRTSRPRWTLMRHWLEDVPVPLLAEDGYREIVRRWLYTFGPGTEDDLVWWLGATKTVVRAALAELAAVPVSLDHGAPGWLLPDDLDEPPEPGPWAALLPVLDPTTMGWRERGFHLGPHREQIFDRNGNGGATAWVDGRIVGCWVQDAQGVVRVHLLEKVSAAARRSLDAEATRLTTRLGGFRVGSVYSSPAMKAAR
jgi:hypothetical protein